MSKYISILIVVIVIILGFWFLVQYKTQEENIINLNNQEKTMSAILHTNKGDITIEFFDKQADDLCFEC